MEAVEIINKIASIEKEVLDYVLNTEHWIFYWIANKEVQDFIKEYPEDYEYRVHIYVENIAASPTFRIVFDEHPNEVDYINRYAVIATFRESAKAKWMEWNDKILAMQLAEKEKEIEYHEKRLAMLEKSIAGIKEEMKNKYGN